MFFKFFFWLGLGERRDGETYGGETGCYCPDGKETARNLNCGGCQRAAYKPKEDMEDFEHGCGLHAGGYRADRIICGTCALVERYEVSGDERGYPEEGTRCRFQVEAREERDGGLLVVGGWLESAEMGDGAI